MNNKIKLFLIIFILLSITSTPFIQLTPSFKDDDLKDSNIDLDNNGIIQVMGVPSSLTYQERKSIYLQGCKDSDSLPAQAARVYMGLPINSEVIEKALNHVNARKDTSDFRMNVFVRMMYFERTKNVLPIETEIKIRDAILNFKYWFDEPNDDNMIMWTENHMILFHTAELLAGQLYPDRIFPNSGMTGTDHVRHATPLIIQWLDRRAKFGFSEFHSNIYYKLDIMALANLVEFSENTEIATKAAMLLDLLAFDFANNYFKGTYATTHGRTEDRKKVGTSLEDPPDKDSTNEAAWLMLGIGEHDPNNKGDDAAIALSTSKKYAPPVILERIAQKIVSNNEHKSRNSIDIEEGPSHGIGYRTQNDLMFWWPMSAPAAAETVDASFELMYKYDLKPELIYNDELFVDVLQIGSKLHGVNVSEYCTIIDEITQGVCLETANTYTYRTPYYQLSGAQDHQKGMDGLQEHVWQASLDPHAVVYTSSPGGISPQEFTGGWKPRATLYKNVGVIQYDRRMLSLDGELISLILEYKPYNHAYFPKWAFDQVISSGKWTFGAKGDSYIALYSHEPTRWVSEYELRALGKKNVWIVELGSKEESGTFEQFMASILASAVEITPLELGYNVYYDSPSRGNVSVSWEGDMFVNGEVVDLGPYPRFDNKYCYQEFGTMKTVIRYGSQRLILDFENVERTVVSE
ncbi:MAG: hypothetical protein ACTSU4_06380 [Promethearchaeota archaeon]